MEFGKDLDMDKPSTRVLAFQHEDFEGFLCLKKGHIWSMTLISRSPNHSCCMYIDYSIY